jgi:hypothetical protein
MAAFGKPDRTGRSSGKLDRAERKLLGPPGGVPWVWLTRELLASDAWRTMSPHCRRFVDFLLVEHCNHAGRENGRLRATYDQLEQLGLRRKRIRAAINEAVHRGLVEVTMKGGIFGIESKRTTSRYRLTWLGCLNPQREPTNNWRHYQNGIRSRVATGATAHEVEDAQKTA